MTLKKLGTRTTSTKGDAPNIAHLVLARLRRDEDGSGEFRVHFEKSRAGRERDWRQRANGHSDIVYFDEWVDNKCALPSEICGSRFVSISDEKDRFYVFFVVDFAGLYRNALERYPTFAKIHRLTINCPIHLNPTKYPCGPVHAAPRAEYEDRGASPPHSWIHSRSDGEIFSLRRYWRHPPPNHK